MPPEIGAAIIGALGVALGGAITYLVTRSNAASNARGVRGSIARYARSELESFVRHCEANMVKIDSLVLHLGQGRQYDYRKFSYSPHGLRCLTLIDIHALHEKVLQDLLRLNLIIRNTEFHVDFLLDWAANQATDPLLLIDELQRFRKRLDDVVGFARQVSSNLTRYARAPNDANDVNINWPKTFYQVTR